MPTPLKLFTWKKTSCHPNTWRMTIHFPSGEKDVCASVVQLFGSWQVREYAQMNFGTKTPKYSNLRDARKSAQALYVSGLSRRMSTYARALKTLKFKLTTSEEPYPLQFPGEFPENKTKKQKHHE